MRGPLPAALACLIFAPLLAAEPLKEVSPSPSQILAQIEWLHRVPSSRVNEDQFNALIARIPALELRLDTRGYEGRAARIHVSLPQTQRGQDPALPVRLSWRARGSFLNGEIEQGQRGLLYEGPITGAVMGDVLDFSILLDARSYEGSLSLDWVYEIETQ